LQGEDVAFVKKYSVTINLGGTQVKKLKNCWLRVLNKFSVFFLSMGVSEVDSNQDRDQDLKTTRPGLSFLFLFSRCQNDSDDGDSKTVNCKSLLCLNVRGLFNLTSMKEIVQALSDHRVIQYVFLKKVLGLIL
jgi:hypothetical protein